MSGHADTIRTALRFTDADSERYALVALDALVAENECYAKALLDIRRFVTKIGPDGPLVDQHTGFGHVCRIIDAAGRE